MHIGYGYGSILGSIYHYAFPVIRSSVSDSWAVSTFVRIVGGGSAIPTELGFIGELCTAIHTVFHDNSALSSYICKFASFPHSRSWS